MSSDRLGEGFAWQMCGLRVTVVGSLERERQQVQLCGETTLNLQFKT